MPIAIQPGTACRNLIFTAAFLSCAIGLFGQGGLNPPGAPAPTMKTLEQIEPRVPISVLPFTITNAGSYYVLSNLTGSAGITIQANDVTLDLNGFALIGTPGSASGITSGSRTNISIRNGTLRNWGGPAVALLSAVNVEMENVRSVTNSFSGFTLGVNSIIRNCTAVNNGSVGFSFPQYITAIGCSAIGNGSIGFSAGDDCSLTDCTASGNGTLGMNLGNRCVARRCVARNNGGDGITTLSRCTVDGCEAWLNGGDGIEVGSECKVTDNTCRQNLSGVHATGNENRIQANQLTDSTRGLDIDGVNNLVVDNLVRDNFANHDIIASNQLTLIVWQADVINWPATVKLGGSITLSAPVPVLTINSSDVTVDLGGHSLIGAGSAVQVQAILVGTWTNVTIRNGSIRGWGTRGIDAELAVAIRIADVSVSNCGSNGITTGSAATVFHCTVTANGRDGISVDDGSSVTDCTVRGNGINGIKARSGCTVRDCTTSLNGGDGIQVLDRCLVERNLSDSNGPGVAIGAGIHILGQVNRVVSNHLTGNDRGLDVDAAGNLIILNSASNNTTNYDSAGGNILGAISAGGEPFTSSNPYHNFSN